MNTPPLTPAQRIITLLFIILLAGVYLVAAAPKIQDPAAFAQDVANYRLLPDALVNIFALALPWLELLCATALLIGRRLRTPALCWILLLGLVFMAGHAAALARGLDIHCGCFSVGSEGKKAGWSGIGFNLILTYITLWLLRYAPFFSWRSTEKTP